MKIQITESDIHRMVREAVKRVLTLKEESMTNAGQRIAGEQ